MASRSVIAQIRELLGAEHDHVDGQQRPGHDGRGDDWPPKVDLRLPDALVALGHALGALEAHGGVAHAVGADGTVTPLAADPGLLSGVPVARGHRLRGLLGLRRRAGRLAGHDRSLWLRRPCRVCLSALVRHRLAQAAGGASRAAAAWTAGRCGPRVAGGRCGGRRVGGPVASGQVRLWTRSMVTDSRTTSSTGRSCGRSRSWRWRRRRPGPRSPRRRWCACR